MILRARALAQEEKRTRSAKRRVERWVDVTDATSKGEVGRAIKDCRRGVMGGRSGAPICLLVSFHAD